MDGHESVRETEYDTLCFECQSELNIQRPQMHGMVVFKGDYDSIICDRCEEVILF